MKKAKTAELKNEGVRQSQRGQTGQSLWGKQSRGYRGKAEGAASIVPHNRGFVQSEGGWDQGAVCVGAGREAWSCRVLAWEMRPLVGAVRAGEEGW